MVQEGIALANLVNAHGGYWAMKKLAEVIAQTIIASA
jgi:hypothetical protein